MLTRLHFIPLEKRILFDAGVAAVVAHAVADAANHAADHPATPQAPTKVLAASSSEVHSKAPSPEGDANGHEASRNPEVVSSSQSLIGQIKSTLNGQWADSVAFSNVGDAVNHTVRENTTLLPMTFDGYSQARLSLTSFGEREGLFVANTHDVGIQGSSTNLVPAHTFNEIHGSDAYDKAQAIIIGFALPNRSGSILVDAHSMTTRGDGCFTASKDSGLAANAENDVLVNVLHGNLVGLGAKSALPSMSDGDQIARRGDSGGTDMHAVNGAPTLSLLRDVVVDGCVQNNTVSDPFVLDRITSLAPPQSSSATIMPRSEIATAPMITVSVVDLLGGRPSFYGAGASSSFVGALITDIYVSSSNAVLSAAISQDVTLLDGSSERAVSVATHVNSVHHMVTKALSGSPSARKSA